MTKVKKVVYPFWAIALMCNSVLLIGYYYQDKLIEKNAIKRAQDEKVMDYLTQ